MNNINFLIEVDSIVLIIFCTMGIFLPKIIKMDEDERYGLHAVLVSFLLGFLVNALIFFVTTK